MNKNNQSIPVEETLASAHFEATNLSVMKNPPVIRDNTPEEEAEIQRQIAEDSEIAEIPRNAKVIKRGRPFGQTNDNVTVRMDNLSKPHI